MATDTASSTTAARSRSLRLLRRGALALVIAVLAVEAWYLAPQVRHSWEAVGHVRWLWAGACVVAAAVSMETFSRVQRTLFAAAGVRVSALRSAATVYAANSISCSLPAGQVLATTFTYRQTRRWGATPMVASWQVITAGLIKGVGLALIGVSGAFLAGATTTPFSLIFTVGVFLAFLVLAQFIASRPDDMSALSAKLFAVVNRVRKRPAETGLRRWQHLLDQLQAVRLNRWDGLKACGWSMTNWIADIVCLACACYATGSHPSIPVLLTAYAVSKTAGVAVPLLPGGLGVVEMVLVSALVKSGIPFVSALPAVVAYRLVSFFLITAIGWVVFFFLFRKSDPLNRTQRRAFDDEPLDDEPLDG